MNRHNVKKVANVAATLALYSRTMRDLGKQGGPQAKVRLRIAQQAQQQSADLYALCIAWRLGNN